MLCQHRWENVAQARPSYGWPSQKRPGIESNQETGRGGNSSLDAGPVPEAIPVINAEQEAYNRLPDWRLRHRQCVWLYNTGVQHEEELADVYTTDGLGETFFTHMQSMHF